MAQRRALEEQNVKQDKRIHELSSRLKQSDDNARKQVDQVIRNYLLHSFHHSLTVILSFRSIAQDNL